MKIIKLYIENFSCHKYSEIDFTLFNSALIVGKVENSDLYSNGVGKSTIFKAIEYVLFNQSDSNLERLIRDDCNSCRVGIDFTIDDVFYRIVRTRTRKGASDVSFFSRTSADGEDVDVFKLDADEKYWKNISGRRSADTEKEINKLIKINFPSFRSTLHFVQNDISGLATATPTKRKLILKETLQLLVYNKLEKIARDKYSNLSKELDKYDTEINYLNDEMSKKEDLSNKIRDIDCVLYELSKNKDNKDAIHSSITEEKNKISSKLLKHNDEKNNLQKEKQLINKDINSAKSEISEYDKKKTLLSSDAKKLIDSNKKLEEDKQKLQSLDFSMIEKLSSSNDDLIKLIAEASTKIEILNQELEQLMLPIPEGSSCKYCRQILTTEHIEKCKSETNLKISKIKGQIASLKEASKTSAIELENNKKQIITLKSSKDKLSKLDDMILSNSKELDGKKNMFNEYKSLISSFEVKLNELTNKNNELDEKIKHSETNEVKELEISLKEIEAKLSEANNELKMINSQILENQKTKAIINHKLDEIKKIKEKKKEIDKLVFEKRKYHKAYPYVLQSLSSSGIPNIIIQNMLDDLQEEVNSLLPQLHPGLQLTFSTEKTKSDGTLDDTLDIIYYLNSKERDFEQLSGAQKLAAVFGLKLGLAFLLKKNLGIEMNLLLLDEIDQSLDKAGVDAFADIVKKFQDEFTILVITHNDRLKDKFSSAILVEQDYDRISSAKVVSSW